LEAQQQSTLGCERAPLYFDRDLSLIEFQRRVLEEAQDSSNPLLERVKFLSILGSNMDEFGTIRFPELNRSGREPREDADTSASTHPHSVERKVHELMHEARQYWSHRLMPELAEAGIRIMSYSDLDDSERRTLDEYFRETVLPVLTPFAHDPSRPFPHMANLSFNLAILLRTGHTDRFAYVRIPDSMPQLIQMPLQENWAERRFVWLEDLIQGNLHVVFPGAAISEVHKFRVMRDAELAMDDWVATGLLDAVEEGVRKRHFAPVAALVVERQASQHLLDVMMENLHVKPKNIVKVDGFLPLRRLVELWKIDRPDLHDPPLKPRDTERLEGSHLDVFASIRRRDILLHHPYDSFQPTLDFLQQAACDPDVLAIKMTLYRIGPYSPILRALLDARTNGKSVTVVMELKARFDEENNVAGSRALEAAGAHVVYGMPQRKVHAKICLVVRREGDGLRSYVHLSSGNYNPANAKIYTDLALLTCNKEITADASEVFNCLTGLAAPAQFRKLLVAPYTLRQRLQEMIEREIDWQKRGRQGRLIFKMNALVDRDMIQLLYRASQEGVRVDLIVRGICCLRPGVPGVSDNIRVRSIVGRFLEHSRVYYFENGGESEVYLGSADLRSRNLDRRVEVLFPIEDFHLLQRVRDEILALYLADTVKARELRHDGLYSSLRRIEPGEAVSAQEMLQWL